MNPVVAIIGAGELGSRHLQGLKTLPRDVKIYVIDPSHESLKTSEIRWKDTGASHKVEFLKELPADIKYIDCAILSSSANVRAEITRQLLNIATVKTAIFEKVLFQNIDDYDAIDALLKQKNIKAWVNCARRAWPVYQEFHKILGGNALIHLHVSGSNWGLGCNSVHMIDLAAWLSESNDYNIKYSMLDREIASSKRAGFIEFTGAFGGSFANGSTFHIESLSTAGLPYTLMIKSQRASLVAHEDSDYYELYDEKKWERHKLEIPYQSQLTGNIVSQILNTGNCRLTPFYDSVVLHKPMLHAFLSHLNDVRGGDSKLCPIT